LTLEPVLPTRPLVWPPLVEHLHAILRESSEIYLVGGVVRDALLQRPSHDLDLVTMDDGCPVARAIADALGGAYYPLDRARGVGRALIPWQGETVTVDIARVRGPDLLTDLTLRDFTINAMAVPLVGDNQCILDPLGGLNDLQARRLRLCAPHAIADDPVRSLRAIRLSLVFGLYIEPETRSALRDNASRLQDCSVERVRDEFFAILQAPRPQAGVAVLQQLGLLQHIVPEAAQMIGVIQSPPHQYDVWRHTLLTVERLYEILTLLESGRFSEDAANVQLGLLAFALSGMREQLGQHLRRKWADQRTHRGLLIFAALLHDIGKPTARQEGSNTINFHGHERLGADIAQKRARALRLSNEEVIRLETIVQHHMRPHSLFAGQALTRRAIYRFWRDTSEAGIDICLLAMADYLATYGIMLDSRQWTHYLELVRELLQSYLHRRETDVLPPPLLTGRDLTQVLGLQPGPLVGELLEYLREAQVMGEINTREEALELARRFLSR
jgi:putative nucleotidyltransferase with HDIG domain